MTYRHHANNLAESVFVCLLGIAFMLIKGENSVLYGVLTITVGLADLVYGIFALRNRRLEFDANGLRFFDWRGRLHLSATWDEVGSIVFSHEVGDDSDYVRIKTYCGTINILGLENLEGIRSRINAEALAARERRGH